MGKYHIHPGPPNLFTWKEDERSVFQPHYSGTSALVFKHTIHGWCGYRNMLRVSSNENHTPVIYKHYINNTYISIDIYRHYGYIDTTAQTLDLHTVHTMLVWYPDCLGLAFKCRKLRGALRGVRAEGVNHTITVYAYKAVSEPKKNQSPSKYICI